ncbi:MAG: peroxiredoxin [Trueperaceae bacterium]
MQTKSPIVYFVLLYSVLALTVTSAQSLKEGDTAFLPTLKDSYGYTVNLLAIVSQQQWLVLWFYPKALTNGCSLQAKRYSDLSAAFEEANIRTFGISNDNATQQCTFIENMKLSGQMLPDTDGILATSYGVVGVYYNRDTILINPEGTIEKIWRNANPADDADRVLEYVKSRR